ncbi:bifunctional metallophosphatase/5'-nucleotidase, partial [Bacillus cereus]|nr:bifunctional metallophosphatase/5'-nucleotidase [Bacillus cereus]
KEENVTKYQEGMKTDKKIKKKREKDKEKIAPLVNEGVGKSIAPLDRKLNTAGESTLGKLVADAQRTT